MPPLPSAASGSQLRKSDVDAENTPSSASNSGNSPILFRASVNGVDSKFESRGSSVCRPGVYLAFSDSHVGHVLSRKSTIAAALYSVALVDMPCPCRWQPQLCEDRTLDFGTPVLDRLTRRRKTSP